MNAQCDQQPAGRVEQKDGGQDDLSTESVHEEASAKASNYGTDINQRPYPRHLIFVQQQVPHAFLVLCRDVITGRDRTVGRLQLRLHRTAPAQISSQNESTE